MKQFYSINKLFSSIQFILIFGFIIFIYSTVICEEYNLLSPDKTIRATILFDKELSFSIFVDGKTVLNASPVSMTIDSNIIPSPDDQITDELRRTINRELSPVVAEKYSIIKDYSNELTLLFDQDYSVVFRLYNNGLAYRFYLDKTGHIVVNAEQADFHFGNKCTIYFPEETGYFSHNERTYLCEQLDTMSAGRLASLPLLVQTEASHVLLCESVLKDYPGMWIETGGNSQLHAVFPGFPLESKLKKGSDRSMPVTRYASDIAMSDGKRFFPWRILVIGRMDADLLSNQLVYQLADERQLEDPSWIKPGKVAWDWWNANNIYGVDFKAGINTQTYKYYIDFAAENGIEYIILDEGWYKLGDLLDVVPELDVEQLISYGEKKNVGVILWVVWKTLDDQLDEALDLFESWGAAGIKVDFMQRDDQQMVQYYWKIAKEAAEHQLLVDFHGAYKPAGLRRAYPNVITREGLKGLEHNKWSKDITPTHNLILPFIRMVAGPMDYTPGAMVNAQPKNFRVIFTRPMSMTTRAHQAAMYIIYESPLQMLADNPANYIKEPEYTSFISSIPTTWDDIRILEAKIGRYIVLARRNRDNWYVGGLTNEISRNFTVDLSFLDTGTYYATIIADGINADRYASDFQKFSQTVSSQDRLFIQLAPAGGWAAIIEPLNK